MAKEKEQNLRRSPAMDDLSKEPSYVIPSDIGIAKSPVDNDCRKSPAEYLKDKFSDLHKKNHEDWRKWVSSNEPELQFHLEL